MNVGAAAIRALVDGAGPSLRRSVQTAVAMALEYKAEREVLAAVESCSTTGGRWLRAELTERLQGPKAAAPLWREVVSQNGCELPDVLLHRARSLARSGETQEAARLFRLALHNCRDYDFYLRSENLLRKLKTSFTAKRKVKIALLSSSTTSLLRGVVEAQCFRDFLDVEVYEPPFGNFAQELLAPGSGLKLFQPDFVVLLLNWRDLGLSSLAHDESECQAAMEQLRGLQLAATKLESCRLIQFTFVPPDHDANHALSSLAQYGRTRTIRRINDRLYASSQDGTILVDSERIAEGWNGAWEDASMWSSAKVYPAPAALPVVGEHIVSIVRAESGLSRKLLVLDLDNTLWGGVIGEDGLGGIQLGPPSALGERYQQFQSYLKELRARGILLALASKNNRQDAMEGICHHPNSELTADDFVSIKVNWEDKASNIRQMATDLHLGLDSFVFLDDNPAERSAVRRDLPDVLVPEISGEPSESIATLERGLYFQAVQLTEEDRTRNASYLAAARQAELTKSVGSMEEYLAALSMQIECGPVNAESSVRVTQLINKTNQFNLTTPRYSREEVEQRMVSPDFWCRWYRLKDRYADHGLIAVLIARIVGKQWIVDAWLMSCRVIGREVESFMFNDLVRGAQQGGAKGVVAQFVPTAKNSIVEMLLPKLGFEKGKEPGMFVLEPSTARIRDCSFLCEPHSLTETRR